MHPFRLFHFTAVLLISLALAQSVAAQDSFFVGPRAMGMGGANVASVDNTTAQYYNPAAFGFMGCTTEDGERIYCDNNNLGRKNWGIDVNVAAGYRLHNDFANLVDDLDGDLLDRLKNGVDDSGELNDLVNLVGKLSGLDDPGNAITVDASGGTGVRIKNFAIGLWAFAQATGQVIELDVNNLGIDTSAGNTNLTEEINAVDAPADFVSDGTYAYFTEDQAQILIDELTKTGATVVDAELAVDKIDFIADQEEIDPALAEDVLTVLEAANEQFNSGSDLSQNTTSVLLTGFGHAEVPLSYGRAINDNLSFGGNIKLMRGRVYGTKVIVFDDDSEDIIAETDENFNETDTVGIDAAMLARFNKINVGLVGRNLNSPKFDGFTLDTPFDPKETSRKIADVTLDPQFVLGVAFIPIKTLVVETDIDLTENETTLQGYDTQNFRLGLEWDAFRALALRAGAYKNIAESDIGWVYTAGLGLNLWAMRLDVAGAISDNEGELDGEEVPTEARVAAQLSVDF